MPHLEIDDSNRIYYNFSAPQQASHTFVFINSSGATAAIWERDIVPGLNALGYGTLTIDFRGQGQTEYGDNAQFNQSEIMTDIAGVMAAVQPPRPILVGLSIGGLHAARVWQSGVACEGLVLVNTLRKKSPLTDWLGELETRLMLIGGSQLLHDAFRPVTVSTTQLGRIRPNHLKSEPYEPYQPDHPRFRLAEGAGKVDWAFPWETLEMPVLVMTGLHDRLFRVEADVRELSATIKNIKSVEFEDEGHALHTENPERFVAELATYARDLPAS